MPNTTTTPDTTAADDRVEIELDSNGVFVNPEAAGGNPGAEGDDGFNSPAAIAARNDLIRARGLASNNSDDSDDSDGCLLSCLKRRAKCVTVAYGAGVLVLFPILAHIATWPPCGVNVGSVASMPIFIATPVYWSVPFWLAVTGLLVLLPLAGCRLPDDPNKLFEDQPKRKAFVQIVMLCPIFLAALATAGGFIVGYLLSITWGAAAVMWTVHGAVINTSTINSIIANSTAANSTLARSGESVVWCGSEANVAAHCCTVMSWTLFSWFLNTFFVAPIFLAVVEKESRKAGIFRYGWGVICGAGVLCSVGYSLIGIPMILF